MISESGRRTSTEEAPSKPWQSVFRDLQGGIISGAYRPRERLIEDEIIARTGATRHAVRRSFDELERLGLVVRQPNRGVQVRDYTLAEIEELYEIRTCLETQAALRFAMPADPGVIERLTDLALRHEQASRAQRFADVFDLNNVFHETLYGAAGNRLLAKAILQYTFSTHLIRTRAFPSDEMRAIAIADHFAMIEAIRCGDNAGLADIIRNHIQRPKDFYVRATFISAGL